MFNANLKDTINDNKYMPYLMAMILFMGSGILGWWGYKFYVNKVEQSAFKDLAESIEAFNKFLAANEKQTAAGIEDRLDDLERAFVFGAQKYGKSKLAPFFYLYKADSLIQKGDFNAALDALNSAINKIEKDNPFYYLLLSKKALLQSDNELSKEQGIKELNDLALDANNPFASMAGYYLGLDYYHSDNSAKAKEIWQRTLDRSNKECSWCELIRTKLENIS